MTVVERVKGICLKPAVEWSRIETETPTTRELLIGYVVPLAAIGPIATLIGGVVLGRTLPFVGTYHVPLVTGVTMAVLTYVMSIVGTVVLSWIINALAPSFGGEKSQAQALKVAVFAYTPAWIAGVFTLFTALGVLVLIAGLYGLYLLYLGLPVLMKSPKEKAMSYTAVVVVCAVVLWIAIGAVATAIGGAGLIGARGLTGGTAAHHVEFDKDSPLGRLQAMGEAMKESGRRMEAAQKSGDQNAQAQAAMQGLGALFGGGKHVDPVGIDVLKPFLPDSFAGLPKTGGSAEKNGMAGLAVSKAEGTYGDRGQKHVTLEISDTGGISALVGMASWMNVQGEKEDDQGFERTRKVDGRLVHERGSKQPGGSSEFTVVLGDRFVVSAKGRGLELADLKGAVSGLDLGKLEAMKEIGVQK